MTEVVVRRHRVTGRVVGVSGQIEPAVEHVVLERDDALLGGKTPDLRDVLLDHWREMEAEVDPRVAGHGVERLRQDLAVRAALPEVMRTRPEVGEDGGHAAGDG